MTEVTIKDTSHDISEKKQLRYQATRNVTLVGLVVNIFLSISQLLGGIFTQSQALIADGVHTLSDLISDIVVLVEEVFQVA